MLDFKYIIIFLLITTNIYCQKNNEDSINNNNPFMEYEILKKDPIFSIEKYAKIGNDFYKKKDFINAEKVFLEILARGKMDTYEYVLAEKTLGDVYKLSRNYNKAIIHYNNVKNKVKERELLMVLNSLGHTYAKVYNYDKALEILSFAYKINEESNILSDQAGTLGLIAWIHTFDESKYEESIKYYEQTLDLFIKINEQKGILTTYANLGDLYLLTRDYNKALEALSKALDVSIELKDTFAQGVILLSFGEAYIGLNMYDEGLKKIDLANNLFKTKNSFREKAITNHLYGVIYLKKNNYINAEYYLKNSLKTCIEIKNLKYIKKNYYFLHELNLKSGDLKNALHNYKNFTAIKDSINSINQSKKNSQYKLNLEFNELEKELTNSKSELKILNQDNQLSKFRIIFLSFSILLILIISSFIYVNIKNRNKRLKITNEKLNYEKKINELIKKESDIKLDFKSRETRDFALNISDKIKLLKTLKIQLQKILKKNNDPNLKKDLNDLLLGLSQNIEVNKDKITLNAKTKDYKKDFIYNLKKISSELNKKEIQVAVYLVMGMSSKEVAVQLGVASRTVDNYRASIRSKLGVKNKQNLSDFLNSLN